jgi:hypothetical protein
MSDIFVKNGYHLVIRNDKHNDYKCIFSGDKIIVRTKYKTIQGEVLDVGRKYIGILTQPRFRCKRTLFQPNIRITINEIEKISKFPEGSQRLGLIESNSNWRYSKF